MKKQRILRRVILAELMAAVSLTALLLRPKTEDFSLLYSSTEEVDRDYIKWVDFQVTAEALQKVEGSFHGSDFVKERTGVDNVCERAALCACGPGGKLIVKKCARDGMTIAIAKREWRIRF